LKKKEKKELEKKLGALMQEYLVSHDYEMSYVNEEYWFKNDFSELSLFQNITSKEDLYIDLRYFAQHEIITPLVQRVSQETMPKWQKGSYFHNASLKEFGCEISEMMGRPEFNNLVSYSIGSKAEVTSVFNHQRAYIDSVVLPYFEHSWIVQRDSYEEIWERIKKMFETIFIYKNYELLNQTLRKEYK